MRYEVNKFWFNIFARSESSIFVEPHLALSANILGIEFTGWTIYNFEFDFAIN